MGLRLGAAIPVFREWRFVPAVAGQLLKVCDRVVVVQNDRPFAAPGRARFPARPQVPPAPPPKGLDSRIEVKAISVGGHDKDRQQHQETYVRNAAMELLSDCDYVFTLDSDEVLLTADLQRLRDVAARGHRAVACYFHTYWKTLRFLIQPADRIPATVVVHRDVRFQHMRVIEGQPHVLGDRIVHHLSYVRTDSEVRDKLSHYGHAHQLNLDSWFERVWKAWDSNREMAQLHPVHPQSFGRAVPTECPELEAVLKEHGVSLDGIGGTA